MILICQYTIQIYTTITLGDINVSGFVQIYYATNATNENISSILAFKCIHININITSHHYQITIALSRSTLTCPCQQSTLIVV